MPKKKYQVIKATTREIPGVYVGGKKRMFDKRGTFTVSDPGEAAEINKVLGAKGTGEVVVTPYKDNTTHEPGHTYRFGASSNFADAWEAFEKRRKDKKPLPKKRNQRRARAEVKEHDPDPRTTA